MTCASDRYGLLFCGTANLGDEIQAIAARNLLPRVDAVLMREALEREPAEGTVRLILNGWFMHEPRHWPPHESIRPLVISIHITERRRSRRRFWTRPASTLMLSPEGRAWFNRHGPIGARDEATLRLLQRHGIAAYLSGCLTLTLTRPSVVKGAHVVACDLPASVTNELQRQVGQPIKIVTQMDDGTLYRERMAKAGQLLELYASARLVVTSRLHCALPCLAMGTPVLFIPVLRDRERQQPAFDLCHSMTPATFLSRRHSYDLSNPPANSSAYLPIRDSLLRRVEDWIKLA